MIARRMREQGETQWRFSACIPEPGALQYPRGALERVDPMLRVVLIVAFLILALIAPVWIPAPVIKVLTARPVATRLDEDD